MRPRRTICSDVQFCIDDPARETARPILHMRPGTRQPNVRRVRANPVLEVRIRIFSSIDGSVTDGDCKPSRNVLIESIFLEDLREGRSSPTSSRR